MQCPMAPKVTRLLHGDLSAAATRTTLNHVRDCDHCQERLGNQGRTAPSAIFSSEAEQRYRSYSPREIAEGREQSAKRSLRGPIALMMIVLIVGAGLWSRTQGNPAPVEGVDADLRCREALAAGLPYAGSPRGELTERPRVFTVALPPGTEAFEVLILERGVPVWEKRFASGDPGVIFDQVEGRSPEGPYDATRGFAPFPGAPELPLEPERTYEVRYRLDADRLSHPLPFRLLGR